jgi:hypothetical protein
MVIIFLLSGVIVLTSAHARLCGVNIAADGGQQVNTATSS